MLEVQSILSVFSKRPSSSALQTRPYSAFSNTTTFSAYGDLGVKKNIQMKTAIKINASSALHPHRPDSLEILAIGRSLGSLDFYFKTIFAAGQ